MEFEAQMVVARRLRESTDCIFHFEVLQCTNNSGKFSLCLPFIRAKYGAEFSANKQTQVVWQWRTSYEMYTRKDYAVNTVAGIISPGFNFPFG